MVNYINYLFCCFQPYNLISMDRFERVVENISRLGTSMFAIRQQGKKPITRDPEFVVLSVLTMEKLPISEIGRRLHRSKPGMSALIGRLLREGKVRRIPSKEDHRVTMIAITGRGRKAIRAKRSELRDRIQMIFSSLADEEIERIDSCLAELNSIIARLRVE
jgi:DNA-binding MarR family transcriptional regulator